MATSAHANYCASIGADLGLRLPAGPCCDRVAAERQGTAEAHGLAALDRSLAYAVTPGPCQTMSVRPGFWPRIMSRWIARGTL